jgi:hypothetical protein
MHLVGKIKPITIDAATLFRTEKRAVIADGLTPVEQPETRDPAKTAAESDYDDTASRLAAVVAKN